ncbi:Pus4p [Saccharomyces cerevisiae AWRI796]|nr:Pus4p [Saccharomyces cerevisiae AWRI796]
MNGIFAIEKPSGITSNQFMLKLQHALTKSQVFSKEIQRATAERKQQYEKQTGKKASKRKLRKVSKVKMGHGGTLDPLASGVLVIGIGAGTKKLANYLSGTVKVYESEALFGVSTTSGDVEGEILSQNSVKHLNFDDLKTVEEKFVGQLKQTPPIYAALKMDGKPLHEYAREGKPLPRAIEPRQVTIYDLKVFSDSLKRDHDYPLLRPTTEEAVDTVKNLNANMLNDVLYFSKEYTEKHGLDSEVAKVEEPFPLSEQEEQEIQKEGDSYRAPKLHFKANVSSGTYIRSLVSDIGKSMRSSCYMVKLIRLQQQDWSLEKK